LCFLLVAFPPRLMGKSCERTHKRREMPDLINPVLGIWSLNINTSGIFPESKWNTHQTVNDGLTTVLQVRSLSNGWRHLHNYGISWKHTGGWTSNLDASQDSYPSNSSSKKKIPFSEEKKNCPKLNKLHNPIRSPLATLATLAELSCQPNCSWNARFTVFDFIRWRDDFSEEKKIFFLFLLQLSRFYQDWIFFCWKNAAELYTLQWTDQFLIHIYSFGNPNP